MLLFAILIFRSRDRLCLVPYQQCVSTVSFVTLGGSLELIEADYANLQSTSHTFEFHQHDVFQFVRQVRFLVVRPGVLTIVLSGSQATNSCL